VKKKEWVMKESDEREGTRTRLSWARRKVNSPERKEVGEDFGVEGTTNGMSEGEGESENLTPQWTYYY
jgi:hypothetical protein